MKYNVKGMIWSWGDKVEVNENFNTIEEAEAYCADKVAHMDGEQFVITPYLAW